MKWSWLCLLLLACETRGGNVDAALANASHTAETSLTPSVPGPAPAPQKPPAAPRVVARLSSGGPTDEGKALRPGDQLGVPKPDHVRMDFAHGARVDFTGPGAFGIPSDSERPRPIDGLLVQRGHLNLELLPSGPNTTRGFWLATPTLRLEVGRAATLALRVLTKGDTLLSMLAGAAVVTLGAAPSEQLQLTAGDFVSVDSNGKLRRSRPTAAAATAMLKKPAEQRGRPDGRAVEQRFGQLTQRLTEAEQRVKDAQERHRSTLRASGEERLKAQAELATHATSLARVREQMEVVLDQRAAIQLDPEREVESIAP